MLLANSGAALSLHGRKRTCTLPAKPLTGPVLVDTGGQALGRVLPGLRVTSTMSKAKTKSKPPTDDLNVIMPDVVRPALADMVPDDEEQEISGQDVYEDETFGGHVIRPGGNH